MIKGIGNDIIEIKRIAKAVENSQFLEKHFTNNEIELFNIRKNNIEVIAGNFVVKEAVSKMLGTGFRNFSLIDIEVLRDELGKPYVLLYNEANNIAKAMGITQIFVSIAHTKNNAIGFAVGEGVK